MSQKSDHAWTVAQLTGHWHQILESTDNFLVNGSQVNYNDYFKPPHKFGPGEIVRAEHCHTELLFEVIKQHSRDRVYCKSVTRVPIYGAIFEARCLRRVAPLELLARQAE